MTINANALAAKVVEKVRTPAIPYVLGGRSNAGTDCINLVGWCVQELGGSKTDVPKGSNTAWRTVMSETWTLKEAQRAGKLVPGALVYIRDTPTAQWPDGDYGHVGVYVGRQAGWDADRVIVHASASRQGVYPSTLKNAWTHVAWLKCVSYGKGNEGGSAGIGPQVMPDKGPEGGHQGGHQGGHGSGIEGGTDNSGATSLVRVTTNGGTLNIRQTPQLTGTRLGSIPNGTLLEVFETRDDWARVSFDGKSGWVSTQYLLPFMVNTGGCSRGAAGR
ncbi:hypothetical protein FACS1894184_00590 [Clostridia bacterium]|nr:hypothetical protein FACS1894184_00590 [Clostridia bacterium]